MAGPTFLSRDIDYLGELGAHLRGLTGYRSLAHELIQNADDVEGADEMTFDVRPDALVVDNNGVFSECADVTTDECHWKIEPHRLCDFHRFRRIASGDKREETGTTGAFGIGFISVYQITDHPELLSAGRHWRLQEDKPAANRIVVCPGCPVCQSGSLPRTRFVLPWAFDSDSILRGRLRVAEVETVAPSFLLDELERVLAGAMLFLKRLKTLSLRKNGDLIRKYERIDEGQDTILSDGDPANDTIWHLLTGSFSAEAEALRSAHPGRIEPKRRADVTLAIDASLASRGLLWACLPTEHDLGVPFHVNADFFPTVDRKRILFDQDYQAQWNRLAIKGAATVLADSVTRLTRLLEPVQFWTLVKAVKGAADPETAGEEAGAFWSALATRLRSLPTVFTTSGEWASPEGTHLLQSSDEAEAVEVLNGLGIKLVHEDLRPFQTLIREALGIPILEVSHVCRALTAVGLNQRRLVSDPDVPTCLRSDQGWDDMWNEIVILLARRQFQPHARAVDEELLHPLAITPGRDGARWPCRDIYEADESTIDLFGRLGVDVSFVSSVPAFAPLRHLCSQFGVSEAIDALTDRESTLEERWHKDPNLLVDLFAWLEDRRSHIVPSDSIKQQIRMLRLFPSTKSLRTLDEVALPGGFNDPIGLADLVDVNALGGRREFLTDLGMKALDFNTYVSDRVPAKIREGSVTPEQLRQLRLLLSTHLGEFRDNTKTRQALSEVSLLEGNDGSFHAPSKSYFDTEEVRACLADRFPIVRLPADRAEAVRELLSWLGVERLPRFQDLCTVIESTIGNAYSVETAAAVRTLFAHLAERVKPGATPSELTPLKNLAWLPARGRSDRWYEPAELYASYQAYLFESEGLFLDVPHAVQNNARQLVGFLGVHATPETSRVVKHLLNSVERSRPVNTEVYRFLNDRVLNERASEPSILQLRNKPCLWIESAYWSPQDVFWQSQPFFGTYRKRLSQAFAGYRALLDRIGVREEPSAADAVAVLHAISDRFGTQNLSLDDDAHAVIMACWRFLDQAIEDEDDTPPAEVPALRNRKCIPNADRLLMPPEWMFFENRAGLAAKFNDFLAANVIPRPIGSSRAMAAAGVQSLGSAVQFEVLDLVDPMDDDETTNLLVTRRPSIARVLDAQSSGRSVRNALSRLGELVCQQCRSLCIRYRLQAFGRDEESPPEFVPALYNPRMLTLTVVKGRGKISWAAVARELATALLPEEDPGSFAAGLKEVLVANDEDEARVALDELGFARLQEESEPLEQPAEVGGALGEDTPPPDDFPASTEEPTHGTAPQSSESPEDTPPPPAGAPGGGGMDKRHKGRQQRSGKQRQEIWRSYVVPADPHAQPPRAGGNDYRQRTAIDKAGIDRVIEFERRAERLPTEMPHTNPGYDVESRDGEGVVVRYIEVKSLSGTWNGTFAMLSRTQFDKAHALDDEFWLYVVEWAESDDFRIHRIPNPAANATRYMFDDGWRALGEEPEYPERPTVL